MTRRLKLLVTAYDFSPQVGGISNCAVAILSSISRHSDVELALIARSDSEVMPFKVIPVKHASQSWLASFRIGIALIREIRRNRPDATFHFLWWPEGLFVYLYSRFSTRPIPYFIMVHGMEVLDSRDNFRKKLRAKLNFLKLAILNRATRLIAVSRFTSQILVERVGIPESRIRVIYHGVDPERFTPAEASSNLVDKLDLHGKKVFLTVTRLDSFKGVDNMILALKNVVSSVSNVMYVVVGAGKDDARLKQLVIQMGLEQHVKFAGMVPTHELQEYYRASDCFVLLSRNAWQEPNVEGFGISILEAAACAKPSLVSNGSGMLEAIDFERNGWSVDPDNVLEIEQKVIEILSDDNERIQRGINARNRVVSYFNWDRTAVDILNIVKQKEVSCVE